MLARRWTWPIFASMAIAAWALLEAASILAFRCFFLRCADSALIVLAVRGSCSLRLADAPAVSILRRRTKLDGKTNEQVKDRRAHGRQGRDAKESRSAVLRRTVQAGGQGGQGRRGQIRHSEHRTRGEGAPQGAHGPQSADGRGNQDQGEDSRASPRGKSVQRRHSRLGAFSQRELLQTKSGPGVSPWFRIRLCGCRMRGRSWRLTRHRFNHYPNGLQVADAPLAPQSPPFC